MTLHARASRSALEAALTQANRVADRKSALPAVECANLFARGGTGLAVRATDLNQWVTIDIPKAAVLAEGSIWASAKTLLKVVQAMPDGELTLTAKVERRPRGAAVLTHTMLELAHGVTKVRLTTADGDAIKFPDHRAIETKTTPVNASSLRQMMAKVAVSVSKDETRFHLNGALLEVSMTTARLVSTDGHRLGMVEHALPGVPPMLGGVIIRRTTIDELVLMLADVGVGVDMGMARIAVRPPYLYVTVDQVTRPTATPGLFATIGPITLIGKLVDASFPPYQQVIPERHPTRIVVDRARLIAAATCGRIVASDSRGLRLTAPEGGPLTITAEGSGDEDDGFTDQIAGEFTGPAVTFGINPHYLLTSLAQIEGDQVVIGASAATDPITLSSLGAGDYKAVLMPMRIT